MNIEIINTDGDEITSLTLDSNPFLVNQVIHLDISNVDPTFWSDNSQKEVHLKTYKIIEILHFIKHVYGLSRKHVQMFTVSVTVVEI